MKKGEHGFTYPHIDGDKCINCGLCIKKCPANTEKQTECTMKNVYAAWNVARDTRKKSTSGGVCSLLENEILKDGGAIVGVKWDADFHAKHSMLNISSWSRFSLPFTITFITASTNSITNPCSMQD